jgi:hypothetical protein
MLEQLSREYLQLYPQARILAASGDDLAGEERRANPDRTLARAVRVADRGPTMRSIVGVEAERSSQHLYARMRFWHMFFTAHGR